MGRRGENLATCVTFDCTGLAQLYGDGTAELLHELKDGTVYPVAVTQDGASVSWTVSASDTATVGAGRAELRWYVGDTLAKSAKFRTSVSSALADGTTETPPAPQQSWVDKVLQAAQEIKDGAISDEKLAAAIAAYLDEHPIDAGLDEAELAAYLAENGYLTNTELADAIAQALADAKSSGEFNGAPGVDGTDGGYYTPSVDADGNLTWTPSAEDMPTVAGVNIRGPRGEAGAQGPKGDKGDTGAQGPQGPAGANGQDGIPGKSAYQYAVDGGYTGTEEEFAEKLAAEYAEIVSRIPMTSEDTSAEIQPNKLYVWPEMESLTLTLATPEDASIANEYHVMFTSGATATELVLPNTVSVGSLAIETGKVYELSILDDCLTHQSWAVTG